MRAPGRRPGARLAAAGLAAAVVATAVTVVVFHAREPKPDAAAGPGGWVETDACDGQPVREICQAITNGDTSWRYALIRSQTSTADTVLVDLGGPGQAVLSGSHNLGAFGGDVANLDTSYNLLFIEEPWVTQETPAGCDDALSALFNAVRAGRGPERGPAATGGDVARACQLAQRPGQQPGQPIAHRDWGFDPAVYADVVAAIAGQHKLVIKGFIGHSWGAARLNYLMNGVVEVPPGWHSLAWSVLVRPYPLGVDARVLIAERTRVIRQVFPLPLRPIRPTTLDGRVLPVTIFDQASAIIELGYVEDEYVAAHARRIFDGTGAAEIGALSDQLWQRYGRDSVSPAKLAEWQEVCPSAGAHAIRPGRSADQIAAVLEAGYAVCRPLPRVAPTAPIRAGRMCVVTSPKDTVAPGRLIRRAYAGLGESVTWVDSPQRRHGSFDGLDACLARVAS
jgi:hypothetical protein